MQKKDKKISFKGQSIYAGIDCHLKSWTVTIFIGQTFYKTFSMDPKANKLSKYLQSNFPEGDYHTAYEAGFCGFSVHRGLASEGINNIIVNAADIPTTDKEKKQKEDKRDSKKIAKALSNGDLQGIYIPSIKATEFRGLIRYRKSLVKEISRNKNRIKSFLHFNGISIPRQFQTTTPNWSGKFSQWLKSIEGNTACGTEVITSLLTTTEYLRHELLRINKIIRSLMKEGEYASVLQKLMTIPGVGLIVASTILAEIGDIKRFKKFDHLCSFVGLVPSTHSSGENDKTGKMTKRSNHFLREILIESAWIATRNDPALALNFLENSKRMKKNEAIVRTAKKMLNRIRYVMQNEKEYSMSIIQ